MPLFSQRKGIRPIHKAIQHESVDEELRNRLWSLLKFYVWDNWREPTHRGPNNDTQEVEMLCQSIWHNYFKKPLDTLPQFNPEYPQTAYRIFREHFFEGDWWEVYDFLEFVLKHCKKEWASHLYPMVNNMLEAESAAYRFVGTEIIEISDEHEINAIEDALSTPFSLARQHLERSLELLSDKKQPDYRNSIKEAISAVESAAQETTGKSKASLGDCIKKLEDEGDVHPALKGGFLKLYGYTSDSGGIRHALTENDHKPEYAEAKFMLVACAAFINFLAAKKADYPNN